MKIKMKLAGIKNYTIVYIVYCSFFISNCTVGLNTGIRASSIEAPVSFTETFYADNFRLVDSTDFRVLKSFSIEFTKWGISSPLDLGVIRTSRKY